MLNPQLINVVIASLKAAGITTPELSPIRPLPKYSASPGELTDCMLASEHEDPFEDPKVIAIASKLYIQSLGQLDQGHRQRELERQAADLEAHVDALLQQLQEAFNAAATRLVKDAEPLKRVDDLASIHAGNAPRATAEAALNVSQGITALESIIKAWWDLWTALAKNSFGVERGKPFTFMNPNAEKWDGLRRNPTIWEAVRHGEPLTLADSPAHVSQRFQAMINNEQAALEARRESKRPSYLPDGGYPQFI